MAAGTGGWVFTSQAQSQERVRESRMLLAFRALLSDILLSVRLYHINFPIHVGNQVFKSLRLWGICVLQTTIPTYLNLPYIQPQRENSKICVIMTLGTLGKLNNWTPPSYQRFVWLPHQHVKPLRQVLHDLHVSGMAHIHPINAVWH